MKKIMTAAAICACIICTVSCGQHSEEAEFTEKQSETAVVQTETFTETETVAETTETTTEESAVTTSAPQETTATETTTTVTTAVTTVTTADPVAIDGRILEGRRFSVTNFPDTVYSNEEVSSALDSIDEICSQYSDIMSFAYMNIETGAVCTYRADSKYATCSTVKAPFCKSLLESGIDLSEEISVNLRWGGDSGTVASMPYGTKLTAEELIRYAITESDNTAYYNLEQYYGWNYFNSMNDSLGVNYKLGSSWIFTYCTANDLLKQYVDIYNFAESDKRGRWLIKLMTKTDVETQITAQLADKYTVAHKYGSDFSSRNFHDCAIVYADSPFVLVIMTNQYPETEESCKVFRQLAKQFDILNSQIAVSD